jgi:hypothetical protein
MIAVIGKKFVSNGVEARGNGMSSKIGCRFREMYYP